MPNLDVKAVESVYNNMSLHTYFHLVVNEVRQHETGFENSQKS